MTIEAVGVVVPVHDEEEHLAHCVFSVLNSSPAGLATHVVLVLDSCVDGSAGVAQRSPVEVVTVAHTNVGRARAAGVAALLGHFGDVERSSLWLATTDADTRVAPEWLAHQVALANAGADAVAGTVEVADWSAHPHHVPRRFRLRYERPGDSHGHVHGANLGMRASAYLSAGGFAPLPCGEDRALWTALGTSGAALVSTRRNPVSTSGRAQGRAPGGFADHLRSLGTVTTAGPTLAPCHNEQPLPPWSYLSFEQIVSSQPGSCSTKEAGVRGRGTA